MAREAEVSDEALMLQLAQGDDHAFHTLFGRWKSPLISYFYRSLNDYHRSEDLALQVAARVHAARESYQVISKFSTWLFRIAQNLLRDEFRRSSRHPEAAFRPELTYPEEPAVHGHQNLADLEDWLMHAIAKLKPVERSLILLTSQQGMTPSEAAEVMDITPNHARVLLHKARSSLIKEFNDS